MRFISLCLALAASLIAGNALASPVVGTHIATELIAENAGLAPGTQWLALRLVPDAGWHVYWRNPGDSGLPTRISWTLPAGVSAGDIAWPYPERLPLADLINYGYSGETLLLIPLTLAADVPVGKALQLGADAKWLVCKDICIPGSAHYALDLPVSSMVLADPAHTAAFASARVRLPQPATAGSQQSFATTDGDFSLQIDPAAFPAGAHFDFFPANTDLVDYPAAQRSAYSDGRLRLSQSLSHSFTKAPSTVDGVLVVGTGGATTAYTVHAIPGDVAAVGAAEAAGTAAKHSLLLVLLSALVGGLILNLMPCVFPVLSLKALALAHAGGQQAAERRRDALAYSGGVMASFVAIAGLLIALRASGLAFGWGFQLQSPPFVGFLAYLMFALGLAMSGVFAIGTRWMGVGQSLTELGGMRGSFATGVLAVAVASPCSAPYMGAAIGYALTQPAVIALLVFAILGLGLALPFLLIGFVPGFDRFLPRPGAWMETFKQLLAFPLYLTAAGLIWVLARQTGADGTGAALLGLVLIGFAIWLSARFTGNMARAVAIIAVIAALALLRLPELSTAAARSSATAASAASAVEPFTEQRLAELRAQHRIVFVNFTADWCISCKVNEHVALDSSRVKAAFAARQVVWLEGDWTRYDPTITRILDRFGRAGVPLYLMYRGDGEPQVLPQILTPDIVVGALQAPS